MSPASTGIKTAAGFDIDRFLGPCLITSRNYGKKVHNTSGYQYRPNLFFYNQWYAPTAPYIATSPYPNESLETQFSRLTLQKHGTPLVSSISPQLLTLPQSSPNMYWRPRNGYTINRFQRSKTKPIPQQYLNNENPLLYSIPGCVLPRSSSKRKKRKKRERHGNKLKAVTIDDDRSQDFLSKITSISDMELSMGTDASSSDTTSNSVSCHCCVCDPLGQIWNMERLMISSPRNKFNSQTSYSTNNNATSTMDKGQHRHFEVSSQIITAPNGHKDLEIRLYFSPKKS